MKRIATTTVAPDLHGFGKDGFTSGNPNSGIKPTKLSAQWCNDVQEAVVRCVEISGQTLIDDDDEQLARAIPYLAGHPAPSAGQDLTFEWRSEIAPLVPGIDRMRNGAATVVPGDSVYLAYMLPPDKSKGMLDITTTAVLNTNSGTSFRERRIIRWERDGNASFEGSDVISTNGGSVGSTDFLNVAGGIAIEVSIAPGAPAGTYNVFVKAEMTGVRFGL